MYSSCQSITVSSPQDVPLAVLQFGRKVEREVANYIQSQACGVTLPYNCMLLQAQTFQGLTVMHFQGQCFLITQSPNIRLYCWKISPQHCTPRPKCPSQKQEYSKTVFKSYCHMIQQSHPWVFNLRYWDEHLFLL